MDQETIKKYEDWKFRLSSYVLALTIIAIDKRTAAPPAGAPYRASREAYLSGEMFSIETDPEIYALLKKLKEDPDTSKETRREARLYYERINRVLTVPKEDYVAFQKLVSGSYPIWEHAKNTDNYEEFEPVLREIIEGQKKMYGYRESDKPVYDQMLNDFEPGTSMELYDAFFAKVKERLVPLIQKIGKAEPIDDSFLHQYYPASRQKEYTEKYLLPLIGFTKDWGYQSETEHPFTNWTCSGDCRTTTKYLEHNVASSLFSTIHETGHAWYVHDVNPAYDGSILSAGIPFAMHESQSRFCENYLGRSEAFWDYEYPYLQKEFPDQLGNISVEQYARGINAVRPSLVRTEADELTYPLHILIRYEIEKGLFSGSISTEHLDRTWDEMYEKYLGIHAEKASDGILQDVHWASGQFGYFPTYALGSAYGAQFFHKMRQDMNVEETLRAGRYTDCIAWLKEHIHKYGALYTPSEIMKIATGEAFNSDYYFDYMEDKYSRLYNL